MTWTTINDTILYSEVGPIFHMKASGAVYAGQALTVEEDMEVSPTPDACESFVGVAQYNKADNGYVSVIGPGNIVRMIGMSGSSGVLVGDDVMCSGSEGKISNTGLAAGLKVGVALETLTSSTEGAIRVKLI